MTSCSPIKAGVILETLVTKAFVSQTNHYVHIGPASQEVAEHCLLLEVENFFFLLFLPCMACAFLLLNQFSLKFSSTSLSYPLQPHSLSCCGRGVRHRARSFAALSCLLVLYHNTWENHAVMVTLQPDSNQILKRKIEKTQESHVCPEHPGQAQPSDWGQCHWHWHQRGSYWNQSQGRDRDSCQWRTKAHTHPFLCSTPLSTRVAHQWLGAAAHGCELSSSHFSHQPLLLTFLNYFSFGNKFPSFPTRMDTL